MARRRDEQKPAPGAILVLANKQSGKGAGALDQAVETFRRSGCAVTLDYTDSIEQLRRRIGAAGESTVVLAGGDGSMNAAAPALIESERPFGIIPMGTANDLARTLGIPALPAEAAAIILAGHSRTIDLGRVNGQPFFNVASLGLSSEVARRHGGEMKRRLGVFNYPLSLWRAYRDHRPFRVEIEIDGEVVRGRCTQVAVGNGRHYGGGLTIADRAEIDDGWLRVYYLRPVGFWGLLRLFPAIRLGRLHRANDAAIRRAKLVEVRTKRPRTINVDGELMTETPARFDILPAVLKVFVPEQPSHQQDQNRKDEDMTLLRSDRLLALQDLVEACRAAAQYYEAALPLLQDPGLNARLSKLAQERQAKADYFAAQMAKADDLAGGPPEERAILQAVVTRAKAALSNNETSAILSDCARYETAVLDQAVGAQDASLKDDEAKTAAALAADAQQNLETLFKDAGQNA